MNTQSKSNVCPIPGCNFHYGTSNKTGWYKHVTGVATHPHWHQEVKDPPTRALLFRQEFPNFLPISGQMLRPDVGAVQSILKDLDAIRARLLALKDPRVDTIAPPKDKTGT